MAEFREGAGKLMEAHRIAVVGCGGVSRMHFEAYMPHPERVRLAAVVDTDPERVAWAQRQYGVPRGFTSLDDALAQADWEVAVVCTPTPVREATIAALAQAGKHIMVEKPMADSYAEAVRMVEACERAGVTLAVNQNFRYHYPFEAARQRIAEGRIGRVRGILQEDLVLRRDSGWRMAARRHALSVMGIHWLDGFRWMLGDEARSLLCTTYRSPAIEAAGETDAFVQISFAGGAVATLVESFSCPVSKTQTVVVGERGSLLLTYDGLSRFDLEHRGTPVEQWDNPMRGRNKPLATFVDLDLLFTALEQGAVPSHGGRDNLGTVAMLDGAYRSAAEGRIIALTAEGPGR